MGRLTTHVLDTAAGVPARGVGIELSIRMHDGWHRLASTATNADGRTDAPLLAPEAFRTGRYRLEFAIGQYFRANGTALPDPAFLDVVALEFGIADPAAHYHVPLLASPWSYSTYRGS